MSEISSYTNYLPSILWSRDSDYAQFLGRLLRIFEKILTGIEDAVPFEDEPLETMIDRLPRLFDPRTTDPRFLSWLAAWVGIALPSEWSAYQQRKLVAEMVSIYQRHGSKTGLYTYLDMYALTPERPRIVIDEGEALFRLTFLDDRTVQPWTGSPGKLSFLSYLDLDAEHRRPDRTARLRAIAYSFIEGYGTTQPTGVLLHPSAIAVVDAFHYIVADVGGGDTERAYPAALWRVSRSGSIDYEPGKPAPVPQPFFQDESLKTPQALLIDRTNRVLVLDSGPVDSPKAMIFVLDAAQTPAQKLLEIDLSARIVYPVDMTLDTQGRLVILDRGKAPAGYPPAGATAPRLIVGKLEANPATWEIHKFDNNILVEPTAIVTDRAGCFIVADAGNQKESKPAELVRIDPQSSGWQPTKLLVKLPKEENPLIFPTGMAWAGPNRLYVCDSGLRWGYKDDPANRAKAESAAVYCVDLSLERPKITKITHEKSLVNPGKITMDPNGELLIADRGEAHRSAGTGPVTRDWRARPHEFGVVVHFSQERSTSGEQRNKMRDAIQQVVEEQKPGHTVCWLES